MCAISSGMSLSKLRAFAASFLIFTIIAGHNPAERNDGNSVIYIWTHDSISLGRTGPRINLLRILLPCVQWWA